MIFSSNVVLFRPATMKFLTEIIFCLVYCLEGNAQSLITNESAKVSIQTVNLRYRGNRLIGDVQYAIRSDRVQLIRPVVALHILFGGYGKTKRKLLVFAAEPNLKDGRERAWSAFSLSRNQPLVDINTFAPNGTVEVGGWMSGDKKSTIVCYVARVYIGEQLVAQKESPGLALLVKSGRVAQNWQDSDAYQDL